jgi:cob(I)alamin adenosyltransferase
LVLTGRNPPPGLLALADCVSDIKAVKHPINAGMTARIGVES